MLESPEPPPTINDLPAVWRGRATQLRPYSEAAAHAFSTAADELAASIAVSEDALLSLEAAGRECGYSPDHLGKLVKEGRLPNRGRKHAPKVRRGDLPRKTPGALILADMRRNARRRHQGNPKA